ncbi:MAG: DEAD/DEAH box helicase family protein [Candidatus Binataceae bacterium]
MLSCAEFNHQQEIERVIESWVGAFSYVQEDPDRELPGLRAPQIGGVHAVQAHWSTADTPATVVMPTGTGKTETMLAILVSSRCQRLLVVVPTDGRRSLCDDGRGRSWTLP